MMRSTTSTTAEELNVLLMLFRTHPCSVRCFRESAFVYYDELHVYLEQIVIEMAHVEVKCFFVARFVIWHSYLPTDL